MSPARSTWMRTRRSTGSRSGAERGAVGRVRASLARLGLPADAVVVQEAQPITFAVAPKPKPGGLSLQGRVRPIIGGVQINFPGFLCTLGFNISRRLHHQLALHQHSGRGERPPTGSRCRAPIRSRSRPRSRTRTTPPGAPAPPAGAAAGATPPGPRTPTASPSPSAGSRRRRRPGRSLTITGQWSITGEGVATVGQTVNKVGRTTGWSQGP